MIVIASFFGQLETVKELFRPLSEKLCFRTLFDSQHVKESQTIAKAA